MKQNRKCLLTILVLSVCLLGSEEVSVAQAKGVSADYDELTVCGLNLLLNGSFEEMHRDGVRPAEWGVVAKTMDRFKVVTDVLAARHGARYVTYHTDRVQYLYGKLNGAPSGKLRMTVWARGKGELYMVMSLRAAGWRSRKKPFLGRFAGEPFKVESEKWIECSHVFDIPESVELDGKVEKPEGIMIQIAINGKLALDQCSVAALDAIAHLKDKLKTRGNEPDGLRPFLTIPKLPAAPKIDGEIGEEEWGSAAAVTGFTQLTEQKPASRQTVVYTGFDDKALYFAFRCPHEGKFGSGTTERDTQMGLQSEAIEIWLQPPGGGWVQFMGCPAGGIADSSQQGGVNWNANWQFGNKVKDSEERSGGILLFAKKMWTAEISIPFAELGATTPKPGEEWRINFCRDFSVPKDKKRSTDDWTSWSPITGAFKNVHQFGTARFAPDAPAIQVLKLGDLPNGDLSVSGQCASKKGKVRIVAKTTTGEQKKTVSCHSEDIELAPDKPSPFALSDTLKVRGSMDMAMETRAESVETGQLLLRSVVPFTAMAALRMDLVPVPSEKLLYVKVDASRLPGLPRELHVLATVVQDNAPTGILASATWPGEKPKGELKLDIAKLAPGDYQVKAFLSDKPDGKALASSTGSFRLPEKPEWLGNKIGVTDIVPKPWTPVKVKGKRVVVTQREYRLSDTGLPEQVTALGEDLFTEPPRLKVVVDGATLSWECKPLKSVEKKDNRATWQIEGAAGPLALKGTLQIEFDGFALWEVTVRSHQPVKVDSLTLEFPFKAERALYARAKCTGEESSNCFACLYPAKWGGAKDICSSFFSPDGWPWTEKWAYEMWIGDDERGLSVMCETEEYLRGKKRTEIERSGNAQVLKLHLIDGPYELKDELRYAYMWQATPVKPRPINPKIWHATYRRMPEENYLKRVYVNLDYHALKYISYPELFHPRESVDKWNAIYREHGVKVVPYFVVQGCTSEAPELKPFLREWEKIPVRTLGGIRGRWLLACVQNDSFADYIVWATKRVVDDLGFDGEYHDVSGVHACRNHYHGCGYRRPGEAEWRPTANILANRQVYKRLYQFLKSDGRSGIIFRHGMPIAAVAGFVDVVTQGEDWCREAKNQYERLTPDIFRAKVMRIQYGTPFTWYTFHHYYRGVRFGGRIPLDAILAYSLPHRVLPTEGRAGMWPVWDVTDRFWTSSEFIPYWDPNTPIRVSEKNVLASTFSKKAEKEALLVVANWNKEPRTVEVGIDFAKLGIDPGRARLTRAVKHPIRQPEDPPVEQPMPDKPLVLRDDKLTLYLAGRNLELILIESE